MDILKKFYQDNTDCTYQYHPIPSTCTSMFQKFDWILNHSRVPHLPMHFNGPWEEILAEVKLLDDRFVDHRGGDSAGWASLCLHGLSAQHTDAAFTYPEFQNTPNSDLPYRWTEIAELCPIATKYFQTDFPYEQYERLRFMRLAPGGYIMPHHDSQTFIPGAVNISLNNPEECAMMQQGIGIVPFKSTGGIMMFNTSYDHAVWNRSNDYRYHMIVHGRWDHRWTRAVVQSYQLAL